MRPKTDGAHAGLPGGTRIVCNPAGPGFANGEFGDDLVIGI
jgi:hypothetical protein